MVNGNMLPIELLEQVVKKNLEAKGGGNSGQAQ
jgi:hypothetical protein